MTKPVIISIIKDMIDREIDVIDEGCLNKGSAQVNADAVKTSAGALHKIPICRTPSLRNSFMVNFQSIAMFLENH